MTLRTNRTLSVLRYIWHRPLIRMRARVTRAGSGPTLALYFSIYGSPSEAGVIVKLAVFRDLSGDNVSSTYLVVYQMSMAIDITVCSSGN